ncbi:hypothetical protein JKF63_06177 [Porcisia hertigi]|uniref:Uncharacterized protein n=1 Tax=Porcisia hertigi TaxID=2761500 RepID=A0A836LIV0_9TRYP|nr:hypothetical protein JKF63_06177 [Porcisia hertigi]
MSCKAQCGGFRSLRAECAREPCMANGMCALLNPSASDCVSWCCTSRSGYLFFFVVFFCTGTFALCAAYYLHRLHQINVEAGAVLASGELAVVSTNTPTEENAATTRCKKRSVTVDPALLKELESRN